MLILFSIKKNIFYILINTYLLTVIIFFSVSLLFCFLLNKIEILTDKDYLFKRKTSASQEIIKLKNLDLCLLKIKLKNNKNDDLFQLFLLKFLDALTQKSNENIFKYRQ